MAWLKPLPREDRILPLIRKYVLEHILSAWFHQPATATITREDRAEGEGMLQDTARSCAHGRLRHCDRRAFSLQLATLVSGLGLVAAASPATKENRLPLVADDAGISHSAEAIHQEVNFNAPPARVYDALTDSRQFNRVVQFSAAMQSRSISNKAAEISREAGGAFSVFGGYITGRQIELIPAHRVVQAWRVGAWKPGVYSIARFELATQGSGTKLVLDHTGFPQGQADHLAAGWKGNYWEPLAKVLAG
jgi:uncharacterized protein YndB with AHSA1/START domain